MLVAKSFQQLRELVYMKICCWWAVPTCYIDAYVVLDIVINSYAIVFVNEVLSEEHRDRVRHDLPQRLGHFQDNFGVDSKEFVLCKTK